MAFDAQPYLDEARVGSDAALGKLFEIYSNYLTLLARVQIGRRLQGKADAADVVQETLMEAHRQFPKFRGTSEPELTAWLRRILAGQIALLIRQYIGTKARDIRLEQDLNADVDQSFQAMDASLAASITTPSMRASRREQALVLSDALNKLPDTYREVIILRNLEGMSFYEVAAKMSKTEDSVQKLWVRALAALRKEMGGDE